MPRRIPPGARHMPAAERLESKRKRRSRRAAVVAAASVGFFFGRMVLGPDPGLLDASPPEILGMWVTTDARYSGRAFEIREDEFRLQISSGQTQVSRVNAIRHTRHPQYDIYEITYFTPEGESVHEIHLYADGSVRLRNPSDVVWVRR